MKNYRPVGWKNESHRHYLAAKGIKTKYDASRYFWRKPAPEDPNKSHVGMLNCPWCGEAQGVLLDRRLRKTLSMNNNDVRPCGNCEKDAIRLFDKDSKQFLAYIKKEAVLNPEAQEKFKGTPVNALGKINEDGSVSFSDPEQHERYDAKKISFPDPYFPGQKYEEYDESQDYDAKKEKTWFEQQSPAYQASIIAQEKYDNSADERYEKNLKGRKVLHEGHDSDLVEETPTTRTWISRVTGEVEKEHLKNGKWEGYMADKYVEKDPIAKRNMLQARAFRNKVERVASYAKDVPEEKLSEKEFIEKRKKEGWL